MSLKMDKVDECFLNSFMEGKHDALTFFLKDEDFLFFQPLGNNQFAIILCKTEESSQAFFNQLKKHDVPVYLTGIDKEELDRQISFLCNGTDFEGEIVFIVQ